MTGALEALRAALNSGVTVSFDGDFLLVETKASRLPADVVDMLRRAKPEILDLLRGGEDSRSAEDWRGSSTSARPSTNTTAALSAQTPRRGPSTGASSNGSTGGPSVRPLTAA